MHYRTHEMTRPEALRALDGAPLWARESNPSPVERTPLDEEAPLFEDAVASELPSRCVAHFTHSLWPEGAGARVVEVVRGLALRHRVHVSVLEEEGALKGELQRLGVEPVAFHPPPRVRPLGPSPRLEAVAAWLRASRVEVVHVHDVASALIAVPAALRAGCRVVLERSEPLPTNDRTRRAALRWLTRQVDRVVVDTEAARRRLVRDEGLDAARICVIPPGFDFEAFTTALRAGLWRPLPRTDGAPVVVHVAALEDAGPQEEELLHALGLLRRRTPGLRAFLVGDGPGRARLEQRVGALGLSETVHFLGWRPDVPAVLARATVGVRCSRGEGLSRAVLEGMAAGLPLVVTDAGGHAELVEPGERGLVVPSGCPEELADAVGELLADPAHARRLGTSARAYVARELSVDRRVARLEALYREV